MKTQLGSVELSIVWAPIFPISYIFPFFGHVGVTTSDGTIHDFSGSHIVNENKMRFGPPVKYVELSINDSKAWDSIIRTTDEEFCKCKHRPWNNCHHYACKVLNSYKYKGQEWSVMQILGLLIREGKYISYSGMLKIYSFLGAFLLIFIIFLILG
ncbi:hypothetical protein SteCoe_35852 [Stentor coeruleus]|uniref:LRAT domain-containing protein n=1 Tax=Stentor coeruleus TaxID=5963 RepID=A0A1R2ARP0_9CILI|nr:hypothetical protein SteCoe_35852 [Stentor coeruleus]